MSIKLDHSNRLHQDPVGAKMTLENPHLTDELQCQEGNFSWQKFGRYLAH